MVLYMSAFLCIKSSRVSPLIGRTPAVMIMTFELCDMQKSTKETLLSTHNRE